MEPYFDSVSTLDSLIRRKGEAFETVQLPAASDWDRTQLLACRVLIVDNTSDTLPVLSNYVFEGQWPPEIPKFLDGPPPGYDSIPEPNLVRGCSPDTLGLVWAALAEFHRHETAQVNHGGNHDSDSDTSMAGVNLPRAARPRAQRQPPLGFVDSGTMHIGSSSPLSSSISSQPGSLFTGGEAHGANAPPEDATLHFARLVARLRT